MQKSKQASLSTNYRYKKSNLSKQLTQFCQFRNEYENMNIQNYISKQKILQLKKIYQHNIIGYSKSNSLTIVDRIGCIKINQLNKIIDEDGLIGYFNQRLLQISEQYLQQRSQIIWIIDLNGKIMQLASKKTIKIVTKIIQNVQKYFPQILQKLYLVNTPMLFDTVFNKISDEISQQTLEKIVMLGDQLDLLYEDVDINILPDFLGGEIDQESFFNYSFKKQDKVGVNSQSNNRMNNNNKNNGKKEQEEQEQEQQQEQQFDFSSLKNALSGMKMPGSHLKSVSQTPLNTQADQK